jgi:hypothetical protein
MERNQQYEILAKLKQKNDHCIVPLKYKEDASFGIWVGSQRKFHEKNKFLRQDRKDLLDEVEFVWKSPANRKRPRVSCAKSGQRVAPRTNQGRNATPTSYTSSVKKDDSHGEEGSSPFLVPTSRFYTSSRKTRLYGRGLLGSERRIYRMSCHRSERTFWTHSTLLGHPHFDNQWNQQYEKVVEFKQNNGHYVVPVNSK